MIPHRDRCIDVKPPRYARTAVRDGLTTPAHDRHSGEAIRRLAALRRVLRALERRRGRGG